MDRTINILVVDDRPEGILSVQAVLSQPGYNIIPASSGLEALKSLLNDDFAVILMDVQMPIMNGFETAAVIKTRERSKDIPIIFMSAINQDEQYVYQGYGVGAVDYLLKPFDPYILKSKVAIFVDIYRKNKVIQEQAQKLYESEVKNYTQALDKLELNSLRRYQYLADSIPQVVFRLLPQGEYEYFNKTWFEYTGYTLTASSGMGWKDAIHPEDTGCLFKSFSAQLPDEGFECECRILNKEGQYRWHLIRMEPESYDDPTEVNSWLGTATDIEERKRSEEHQRFLAQAGELLVSSLDYEKTIEDIAGIAVPQFADWCAIDIVLEENKLKNLALIHKNPSLKKKASELHESYLSRQDAKVGAGYVFRTGNSELYNAITGESIDLFDLDENQIKLAMELNDQSVIIAPMSAGGKTIGTITFCSTIPNRYTNVDVSLVEELGRRAALAYENSRLYKLSQQAIEIRNDFLSIASHELNTPITSLKLQLQLTKKSLEMNKDGNLPVDKFTRSIDASVRQVDRLINLVQVLLDVSRIQSGKLTFHFEKFMLKDLLNEVLDRFKEIITTSGCELDVENLCKKPVEWDKTRIEQVIINLLTNAIKYAPGKIDLKVQEVDQGVQILFQDHGKGIPENKLKTIFDRFERASSNETISGLGLGLFIVKQIVDGHGGTVKVESQLNHGTVFTVFLPLDSNIGKDQRELASIIQ